MNAVNIGFGAAITPDRAGARRYTYHFLAGSHALNEVGWTRRRNLGRKG